MGYGRGSAAFPATRAEPGRPAVPWCAHVRDPAHRRGRRSVPHGLDRLSGYPNLIAAMERRGWREGRIRKGMGENRLGLLAGAWG